MNEKRKDTHLDNESAALAFQSTNDHGELKPGTSQPKVFPSLTDRDLAGFLALQGSFTTMPFGDMHSSFNEEFATLVAGSIAPRDGVEALLALQMVKAHNLAMRYLELAGSKNQTVSGIELFAKSANLLLRTFTKQVEALKTYRSKGEQKVEVEHVHVHHGGQAVVGMVTTKGQDPGVGDIDNGEA
jgi:hypothetical protein